MHPAARFDRFCFTLCIWQCLEKDYGRINLSSHLIVSLRVSRVLTSQTGHGFDSAEDWIGYYQWCILAWR